MTEVNPTDRLAYLAKKFEVFEPKDLKDLRDGFRGNGFRVETLLRNPMVGGEVIKLAHTTMADIESNEILALILTENDKHSDPAFIANRTTRVCVSMEVFTDIIAADPTPNKSCVQWMLTTFARFLKTQGKDKAEAFAQAERFVLEDLPAAREYITLFEANKRKRKFMLMCSKSFSLKNVEDPTDINQYKSLSQLYDAVDPFIVKNPSEMEKLLEKYVNAGQALMPVKDRKFTLYIPLTNDASIIFEKFAGWCTAKASNGMFKSYTSHLRPDGKPSRLYIILNNKFYTDESKQLVQIHVETNQIKDERNQSADIFEDIIHQSEGLSNFFYEEFMVLAKLVNKGGVDTNVYLDLLIKLGFTESLFEMMDPETAFIIIMRREVPRLPDLSRFKNVDQIIITNAKMVEIHESIGKLKDLGTLSLPYNKLKSLPPEIGQLKNLIFMNLVGNEIKDFPEEIKYLDSSNGGSLFRLAVKVEDIGVENYKRLERLLPNVKLQSLSPK